MDSAFDTHTTKKAMVAGDVNRPVGTRVTLVSQGPCRSAVAAHQLAEALAARDAG